MDQRQNLQQALATLWPELPSLIGKEWPTFEPKLKVCLAELTVAADLHEIRKIEMQIRLLFFDYEQADARLSALLAQTSDTSQQQMREKGLYGDPLQPPAIIRYYCPGNGTPHWLNLEEIVRSVSDLALCPIHPNTLVTAEKPDKEN